MRFLNQGEGRTVYTAQVDGKECVVKTFDDEHVFRTELRAYEAISTAPTLQGRVCGFLGTFAQGSLLPSSFAIRLAHLDGPDLGTHLLALTTSEDRELLRREVHETLDRLHHDACISHRDITPENIIMHQGHPVLIDFSHARFRHDLDSSRWTKATLHDHGSVDGLFLWADSEHALPTAEALVDSSTPPDQESLARVLDIIERPPSPLLSRIHSMFPAPAPTLAITMARHFRREDTFDSLEAAVKLLLETLARVPKEQQHPSTPETLAMRRIAAFAAGDLKMTHGHDEPPGALQLYRDAIAAYEGTSDRHDIDFLELRFEYASFLAHADDGIEEALDLCGDLVDDVEHLTAIDVDWRLSDLVAWLANMLWKEVYANAETDEQKERAKSMYWRVRIVD
ncbi:hypothetical protein SLS55_010414 [Diplodia seriata]|uniref:EKC/KEOPS complex subunit BUD32 n=1 Tax=Diplodia seriata TaxID=420778 RepID=A0ABR3BYG6_9PEZI